MAADREDSGLEIGIDSVHVPRDHPSYRRKMRDPGDEVGDRLVPSPVIIKYAESSGFLNSGGPSGTTLEKWNRSSF